MLEDDWFTKKKNHISNSLRLLCGARSDDTTTNGNGGRVFADSQDEQATPQTDDPPRQKYIRNNDAPSDATLSKVENSAVVPKPPSAKPRSTIAERLLRAREFRAQREQEQEEHVNKLYKARSAGDLNVEIANAKEARASARHLFERLDKNRDKELQFEEFVAFARELGLKRSESDLQKGFDVLAGTNEIPQAHRTPSVRYQDFEKWYLNSAAGFPVSS